ncbi:MAG: type II secretion system F family protein [Patescibacteria group bacterium]
MTNIFLRVPLSEKMLFAKHLSIMIRSGMSILDSLWLLKKQAKTRSFKKILDQIIVNIDNGQFLSASLEKYRTVFGEFFISIIRIGEATGTLADNLNYLHEQLRKNYELRRKVKAAMIYPVIILIATLGIGSILIFYVFPKIMPIFKSLKVELPITTRILIAAVNFLNNYGLWVIVGLIVFIVLMFILLRIKAVRFLWHRLILALPIFGRVSIGVNMTNFARTLASLLKSGVKIVDAILITSDTMPNLVYQRELKVVAERIKSGETISQYLLEKKKFFPPIFAQMVEVGENTGRLDENFIYLADFYEAEVDEVFKNLSGILEPIMLLVMGGLVGFIAISIISPIYEITQGLNLK